MKNKKVKTKKEVMVYLKKLSNVYISEKYPDNKPYGEDWKSEMTKELNERMKKNIEVKDKDCNHKTQFGKREESMKEYKEQKEKLISEGNEIVSLDDLLDDLKKKGK